MTGVQTCALPICPELLHAAINSLRSQIDDDWEHLIYDDASTDKGVLEVLEWAKYDPRVRIWRGIENRDQPSVLWNFMFDRANGRYLTVLDDDNEKLPTFVGEMSKVLDDEPDLDIVTCGWRVDREEGEPEGNYFLNLSTSEARLRTLSTCDGGAMLYRRETFEKAGYFSEELRTNEDWDWLRRVVHNGKIRNLHEVHSTYRSHPGSRMNYADKLGNDADVARVKSRHLTKVYEIKTIYPPPSRLTQSQRDVCASVENALAGLSWTAFSKTPDLLVVVSPFQQSSPEIEAAAKDCTTILSLHMEDPYALVTNLDRVQRMARLTEIWVCTNDGSTVPYYRKIVGDRVITCPTLGADLACDRSAERNRDLERDIDILLCGYAYPSRKRFVTTLLPLLEGRHLMLVGDGWKEFEGDGVSTMPTQGLEVTYKLHRRAKTVICVHRVHGDCSDGPTEPVTVNRGFMEGVSGARVFIDRNRPYHGIDTDDVTWYNGPGDLAGALLDYLDVYVGFESNGQSMVDDTFAEKCRTTFSYRTRMARILNCVRSPRYLAEIP